MSTRACYVFKDRGSNTPGYGVYYHSDGYPTGAADKITRTIESKLAWQFPRWEADEFAAAFIAANKDSGGGARLLESANLCDMPGDIEFLYVFKNNGDAMNADVEVEAYSVGNWWEKHDEDGRRTDTQLLFVCKLADFEKYAKEYEERADEEAA